MYPASCPADHSKRSPVDQSEKRLKSETQKQNRLFVGEAEIQWGYMRAIGLMAKLQ